jgi:hypothetical protein
VASSLQAVKILPALQKKMAEKKRRLKVEIIKLINCILGNCSIFNSDRPTQVSIHTVIPLDQSPNIKEKK